MNLADPGQTVVNHLEIKVGSPVHCVVIPLILYPLYFDKLCEEADLGSFHSDIQPLFSLCFPGRREWLEVHQGSKQPSLHDGVTI